MATATQEQPTLTPAVRALLGSVRTRIRWYVWLEGLTTAIAWLGTAFWVSLLVDWFFEPPWQFRAVLLGLVAVMVVVILYRLIVRRAFVRFTDGNMAMLLERHFPELDDSLLTAVQLIDHPPDAEGFSPRMLAETCREADGLIQTQDVQAGKVFNLAPLRQSIAGTLFMILTIATYAVGVPEGFDIWAKRSLLLSEQLWPRRTRLAIEGFKDGTAKVARGTDLEVIAQADVHMPLVPKVVHVHYWPEGGGRSVRPMNREGEADPATDEYQEYSYTFKGVLTPIEFDVVGGDDRIRGLRIEVVESPTIDEMVLHCEFPEYMGRDPRQLSVIGVMQIPRGTKVTVEGRANKDLVRLYVDSALEDKPTGPVVLEPPVDAPDRRAFQYPLGVIEKDRTLLFTLLDTDEIKSREPVRLALACMADEPPELSVVLRGIGSAVTPQARLPVVGQVADDYGIAKVWFEHVIDKEKPATSEVDAPEGNLTELKVDDALEVRELELKPGQKLTLSLKASDRCDLGEQPNEQPNVGASERWLLDVVTPDQLRVMLEARELVLRQRFEMIIREVTDTRDSLVRVDFGVDFGAPRSGDAPGEKDKGIVEPGDRGGGKGTVEPGEKPDVGARSPERLLGLRTVRTERAIQNSRKNAGETLGTADAFENVRLQLVNNRIDTEELKTRLEAGIIRPLRHVAEEMFPELEKRLVGLRETLADERLGLENRDRAQQQADAILVEMNEVLGRMLELEDFNEAVALLREIIDAQEKLGKQTKQRHKHDLLED
jgi:hypothetical protein